VNLDGDIAPTLDRRHRSLADDLDPLGYRVDK
jgi:hypothetical protein